MLLFTTKQNISECESFGIATAPSLLTVPSAAVGSIEQNGIAALTSEILTAPCGFSEACAKTGAAAQIDGLPPFKLNPECVREQNGLLVYEPGIVVVDSMTETGTGGLTGMTVPGKAVCGDDFMRRLQNGSVPLDGFGTAFAGSAGFIEGT